MILLIILYWLNCPLLFNILHVLYFILESPYFVLYLLEIDVNNINFKIQYALFDLAGIFASCPKNWAEYGNGCYFIASDLKYSYDLAEQVCVNHNGHLMSVNSVGERVS